MAGGGSVFWSRLSVNESPLRGNDSPWQPRRTVLGCLVLGWFLVTLSCLLASCAKRNETSTESGRTIPTEEEFTQQRRELTARLSRWIRDRRVLDAMAAIPRHEFVPREYLDRSYEDSALPIPLEQSISQPWVVALMTEFLELKGDERVLEVGTGSGYQAAILGRLVSEVYSIEIRKPLVVAAERRLRDLQRRGLLTCKKLAVIEGDGMNGYPDAAPYDRIIVTAASGSVPPKLKEQLKPGGRLVMPVGNRHQTIMLVHKREDGSIDVEESKIHVRFVRLEE